MSLLMDALKKADEAKKKPVVAPSVLPANPDSVNTNQDSPAVTEAQDSSVPNEEAKNLLIADDKEEEEELFLFEITNDETLSTTASTEPNLLTEDNEDNNDFSLITSTNEPFLAEIQQYPIESEANDSWDNEFLPEFQQELEQLENSNIEEIATTPEKQAIQLNEFTAYDEQEFIQPPLAETQEDIATTEDTSERQLGEFNQSNLEMPQEQSALTPAISPVSSRQQAKNWFLSLPTVNRSKLDTTTIAFNEAEVSSLAEPEIEQELVRIEQVTQTELDEPTASHTKPDAQAAQRILAAHTPASSANQRAWWLGGFLGVLLVGIGGIYYYYTQSSLIQPSGLKFGQLNQRLRTNSLSTPSVAETETPPNSPPVLPLPSSNSAASQPTMAPTQSPISKKPTEESHKTTNPTIIPAKEFRLSEEAPTPDPIKLASTIKNNDLPAPTTDMVATDNLLANKEIRAEIAKLVADEITKQVTAKMTMIAAEQKANNPAKVTTASPPKSASAAKTRLSPNKPSTSSPIPTKSTTTTVDEPARIPTVQKNLTEKITNELSSAYKNFHQGNEKLAYETYHQILQQDPNNRDALLGFAALAVRHGNLALARQYYQQVLQLYPQDPHAQVGLINTLNYQPASSESQLKLLLANNPHSAHIHFSLGNLYANQGRWAQAQQAYFDAYRYDSSQADYAYNLAISLDQLNQTGAALNYYQQALRLALNQPVNFNQSAVQKRVQTLIAHTHPSALDNLSAQFEEARNNN